MSPPVFQRNLLKKRMSSRLKYCLLLSACSFSLFALQSCLREVEIEEPSDRISFHVQSDTKAATKSGTDTDVFTFNIGEETVGLSLVTEDNDGLLCLDGDVQTKGSAFDNSAHPIEKINVTAIVENGEGGSPYFNEDVTISGGKGNSERFWPEKKLSFFSYAVSKDNVIVEPSFVRERGESKGSFDYALPAAQTESPVRDATNQPDVVFAINPDQEKTTTGEVNLVFHHALSALIFKVGKMPENVYLNSIAISGVYSAGSCDMSAAEGNDVDFVWSYEGQTQNASYTEYLGKDAVEGEQMGGDEAVFMMIPQTMSEASKLVLSFNYDDYEFTLEKNLNEIITSWEADKKYVFTIGIPDGVKVEVDDQVSVDKTVKSDLCIKNTGFENIYVRAMLYGEWVSVIENDEVVVAPWDMEGDGVFTNFNTTDWLYSTVDGYYYYKYPLEVGEEAIDLFESYELNTAPPVIDTELQLSVVSQGVALRHVENAWGYAISVDSSTGELNLK